MANNGTEGGPILRANARLLMVNYRNSAAFPANNHTEGILFGRDHIQDLLAQPACLGIRVYYGKDGVANTGPARLILVGTDVDGNDMPDLIIDMGIPCPAHCSSPQTKI